jgi:hypothetical protein
LLRGSGPGTERVCEPYEIEASLALAFVAIRQFKRNLGELRNQASGVELFDDIC